jgi:predicted enzyme related to lactoylglutathione lyase
VCGSAVGDGQLHIGIEEPFAAARKAHPAMRFSSDELQAVADRLTAAGASVRCDHELPDVRRFFTNDPWGNRLELLARSN